MLCLSLKRIQLVEEAPASPYLANICNILYFCIFVLCNLRLLLLYYRYYNKYTNSIRIGHGEYTKSGSYR